MIMIPFTYMPVLSKLYTIADFIVSDISERERTIHAKNMES
jgi:hypothetical protein